MKIWALQRKKKIAVKIIASLNLGTSAWNQEIVIEEGKLIKIVRAGRPAVALGPRPAPRI